MARLRCILRFLQCLGFVSEVKAFDVKQELITHHQLQPARQLFGQSWPPARDRPTSATLWVRNIGTLI